MTSDRADIHDVESMSLRLLDLLLIQEQHAEVHVGDEVDVHRSCKLVDVKLDHFATKADCSVVHQNVDLFKLFASFVEEFFRLFFTTEVYLVKCSDLLSC